MNNVEPTGSVDDDAMSDDVIMTDGIQRDFTQRSFPPRIVKNEKETKTIESDKEKKIERETIDEIKKTVDNKHDIIIVDKKDDLMNEGVKEDEDNGVKSLKCMEVEGEKLSDLPVSKKTERESIIRATNKNNQLFLSIGSVCVQR